MKRSMLSLVLFGFVILFTGCGSDRDNKLIMATEAGFAPYEFYENGEIVGVDVEIAKEIANAMGKELEIKDVAFDFIINEVQSGKADFGAAGMSISPERKEQVDFSIEYSVSNQVVIVRNDSLISNFEELKNKKIAVQLGTVGEQYVLENYPEAEVVSQKKYLSAAEDVKSGKADCIIMDELPAKELVASNPELKIMDGILFTDKYGMVVKKGNTELLNKINEVLTRLMNEGKIDEFILKYTE